MAEVVVREFRAGDGVSIARMKTENGAYHAALSAQAVIGRRASAAAGDELDSIIEDLRSKGVTLEGCDARRV